MAKGESVTAEAVMAAAGLAGGELVVALDEALRVLVMVMAMTGAAATGLARMVEGLWEVAVKAVEQVAAKMAVAQTVMVVMVERVGASVRVAVEKATAAMVEVGVVAEGMQVTGTQAVHMEVVVMAEEMTGVRWAETQVQEVRVAEAMVVVVQVRGTRVAYLEVVAMAEAMMGVGLAAVTEAVAGVVVALVMAIREAAAAVSVDVPGVIRAGIVVRRPSRRWGTNTREGRFD